MKKLLQTIAAVVLAASMVPAYAERSKYKGANEFDLYDGIGENNDVNEAAAWAHGVVRATTVCGSLGVGTILALSGYPIAFFGGLACSCLWASYLDSHHGNLFHSMNNATKQKAQYINNTLADGALWTIACVALCMAGHKQLTKVA